MPIKRAVVVDTRLESHGFINGLPMHFYCENNWALRYDQSDTWDDNIMALGLDQDHYKSLLEDVPPKDRLVALDEYYRLNCLSKCASDKIKLSLKIPKDNSTKRTTHRRATKK